MGISGVGKSRFLNSVAEQIEFQHLTGGSLISAAKTKNATNRNSLRLGNIDDNQRLLIDGFEAARLPTYKIAILDGHILVDTDGGSQIIDTLIFRELRIAAFLHLSAPVECIFEQRSQDISRQRPARRLSELDAQQRLSETSAEKAADALNIPFKRLGPTEPTIAVSFISWIAEQVNG